MNKKFKFASAFLSAALLITPISGLVNNYDNIAKAEEFNYDDNITTFSSSFGTDSILVNASYIPNNLCYEFIDEYNKKNGVSKGFVSFFVSKFTGSSRAGAFLNALIVSYININEGRELFLACERALREGKGVTIYQYKHNEWRPLGNPYTQVYRVE